MKFKHKHPFLLRDVVLTGILFTGFMALIIVVLTVMANNYNRQDLLSQQFNDHYNKLNQLTGQVDSSRVVMTNANSSGLQLQGSVDIAFGSTWNVIMLVFSTLDLYASMGDSIVSDFPFMDRALVRIIMYILLGALLVIIIFNVISSVMRGRL